MRLITQVPEEPINEEWTWLTDVMVSENGTEQRVCNRELPKFVFGLSLKFDDANDLRSHIASMLIGAKTAFQIPLYQYQTRLTAPAAIGAMGIAFASVRSELRVGDAALIFDRQGNTELKTVAALTGAGATFTTALAAAWGVTASVCPVASVYSPSVAMIDFGLLDHDASANLKVASTGFLNPFLNPYNAAALAMLNGSPVLEARPIGSDFTAGFDTGIKPTDEGGVVSIRSPWTHAQMTLARTFTCQRQLNPADWDKWRLFADTVKGSWKPFYMPTYRQDFTLTTAPVAGGTTLTFGGLSYLNDWFPFAPFKGVAIFYAGGVHYATVTACANVGGNSQVTFAPALPGGAGAIAGVSLLLKLRIADDKVSCEHRGLHSRISLNLRTVDA
jgi:hypothetical protein